MKKIMNEVLLVEKQESMIHIYKHMLPWQDYQFQITSVTDSEDKAIAFYGEYQYKLVITDIALAEGNGISLIRKLKRLNPECQILVISDHEEYSNVREAFMEGACDYILKKDLRYTVLGACLNKIRERLCCGKTEAQGYLEKLLGWMRDGQHVDDAIVMELLQEGTYPLLSEHWQMLYFRMDNVRHINRNLRNYETRDWMDEDEFIHSFQQTIEQREVLQGRLKELVEESLHEIPHHLMFNKKHSGLIILEPQSAEQLKMLCKEMMDRMVRAIHFTFSMTISSPGYGLQDFVSKYHEVIAYHGHKFYDGDFSIMAVEDQKSYQHFQNTDLPFEQTILHAIGNRDALNASISEALGYMRKHTIYPLEVKQYFVKLIQLLARIEARKAPGRDEDVEACKLGVLECESLGFMKYELYRIFTAISLPAMEGNSQMLYVDQMRHFIHQHLSEKIILDDIANEVGLNKTYAGRIFKKEIGKSIVQYINDEKMSQASKLLENPLLKIKEVANLVGYRDQLYFNKMFKMQYGVSPSSYRSDMEDFA